MNTRSQEMELKDQIEKFEKARRAASGALVDLVCEQLVEACEWAGVDLSEFAQFAGGKNIVEVLGHESSTKMFSMVSKLYPDATVFTKDLTAAMVHKGLNPHGTLSVLYDNSLIEHIRFRAAQ